MRLRKGTVRVCLKLSCENIAISDLAFSTNTLNIVNCKDDNIRKLNRDTILKFLFSKTATKIDEIFSVDVKSTVKISSIFVAFLENINFSRVFTQKFVDNAQQCFAFTPRANSPPNDLNFH